MLDRIDLFENEFISIGESYVKKYPDGISQSHKIFMI